MDSCSTVILDILELRKQLDTFVNGDMSNDPLNKDTRDSEGIPEDESEIDESETAYESDTEDETDIGEFGGDKNDTMHEDDTGEPSEEEKIGSNGDDKKQDANEPAPPDKRSLKEKLTLRLLKPREKESPMAQFMRTWALMLKGNLAPAGNFHLSLMFGPLIFESGLEKYVTT